MTVLRLCGECGRNALTLSISAVPVESTPLPTPRQSMILATLEQLLHLRQLDS